MTTAWGGGTWSSNAWGGTDETVSVTGVYGTGAIGTVTVFIPDVSVFITGVYGTGAIGTVIVGLGPDVPITGVYGTGAIGTVTVIAEQNIYQNVTGVYGTGAIGTVTIRCTWVPVNDIQTPMWQNVTVNQPESWVEVIT